jgi:hypothetical protein
MSFSDWQPIRCAVCGEVSEHMTLASTDSPGPPDLDTRPAETMRSSLQFWILECPNCRYAAPSIATAAAGAAELVRKNEYQAIKCRFQRHSWLLAQLGHYADAGWVSLHAAWMADDAEDAGRARECRGRAVELWKTGKRHGQDFMETTEQEFALVADVLRRRGEFEEALQTCMAGLNEQNLTPLIEDALRFQLTLISRRDTAAHTMGELPKRPQGGERVTLG